VALDLEVDGRLSLAAAHAAATRLEDSIRSELGAFIEVETHIEPLETRELAGREADAESTARLSQTIRRLAAADARLTDIHDVRLRFAAGGRYAIFHCRAPRAMTVREAHEAVDALERAVRREMPDLDRVIGHAEPQLEPS
jgi:divalent metal cation (Fe/Co/Zn/Cd) transporter